MSTDSKLVVLSTAAGPLADADGPPNRRPLVLFIFSLVTFQGLTINLVPIVMGVVARTFQVSKTDLGLLQTTFLAGGILSLLLSGYVTDYIRSLKSGTFAVTTMAVGLLLLGSAGSFAQTLIAVCLIGIGNFWILAAYSSVIAEFFPDIQQRTFMWATAAFAFSAAAGNYAMGFLLARLTYWQAIFLVMGAVILLTWTLLLATARRQLAPLGKRSVGAGVFRTTDASGASFWKSAKSYLYSGLFNRPVLWVLGFLVVLDNLAGGNSVTWTAQLFRENYGINEEQASAMIAASALGVFLGRVFLGAFISGRFSDLAVLGVCYAAAVGSYGLLLLVSNYYWGVALCFLSGALMSAQAPTMYSIAVAKFGARAATAIPLIDAIGILGSFMGPAVVGALADESNLRSVLWFIPATGVVFVTIVVAWDLLDRLNKHPVVRSPNVDT